jgi:hypothetical protein
MGLFDTVTVDVLSSDTYRCLGRGLLWTRDSF